MKFNTIRVFLLVFLSSILLQANSQNAQGGPKPVDKFSLGIGFGLDCGGIGANLTVFPQRNIGIFAGGGYAFAGFGYNFGLKLRAISDKPGSKVSPFVLAMYGYNAAIAVMDQKSLNKFFYGPSIGIGLDTRIRPTKNHYWSFALLVPFREAGVQEYMDDLKNNHGVDFQNELFPIAFSISYKFVLN